MLLPINMILCPTKFGQNLPQEMACSRLPILASMNYFGQIFDDKVGQVRVILVRIKSLTVLYLLPFASVDLCLIHLHLGGELKQRLSYSVCCTI